MVTTHAVHIGSSTYYVQGSSTAALKEIACTIGLKYDAIVESKLSDRQTVIKVWAIGKLKDHLDSIKK